MIAALVTGSLFRNAASRETKTAHPFVTATIRIKGGEGSYFVRIVAFSGSVQSELMRLAAGDALIAQGPLTVSIYTSADGNAKVGLSIVADHVLALRKAPRERKAKAAAPDTRSWQEKCAGSWQSSADGPNDDLPFGGEP